MPAEKTHDDLEVVDPEEFVDYDDVDSNTVALPPDSYEEATNA